MSIRFGIIGYGNIAPFYVNAINNNPKTKLVSICDSDLNKKDEIIKQGYLFYSDYRKLLKSNKIDVVIISLPNYLHTSVALDSLDAGKHVICEKPMALNLVDAKKMVSSSKSNNKSLFIAFHDRYDEKVIKLKEKNIKFTNFSAIHYENVLKHCNLNSCWNFNKKYSGGGCIIDNGINFIDVLYEFINPLSILSSKILKEKNGVETKAKLDFKEGRLDLDWDVKEAVKKIFLLDVKNKKYVIDFRKRDASKANVDHMMHQYENLLNAFIKSLNKECEHGERGLIIQKIINEIYCSKSLNNN